MEQIIFCFLTIYANIYHKIDTYNDYTVITEQENVLNKNR